MNAQGQKLKIIITLIFLVLCQYTLQSQSVTMIKTTKRGNKVSIKSKGTHDHFGISNNYTIEYEGDFELSDDDTDVISVSRGGYLGISKTTFGSKRKVLIENGSGGKLEKTYYVSRKKTPFDLEGKKWLADVLPEIVRSTGIAAKSRVDRFYEKGGVLAVLGEIEMLNDSYVKAMYAKLLLEKDNLSGDELSTVLNRISDEISSDYYLADIIKSNSTRFLMSDVSTQAYLNAIGEISSDYYLATVLKEAINNNNLSEKHNITLIRATKNISSDYYMWNTLREILKEKQLNDELLSELISASEDISSDYYASNILSKVIEEQIITERVMEAFTNSLQEISSGHYMTKIIKKAANNNKLTDKELIKLIEATAHIGSDSYLSTSLIELAPRVSSGSEALKSAYRRAAKNISSDTYYGRTLKAID